MAYCCVLWDDSQLWGLLVIRALEEFQVPFKVLRAHNIAHTLNSDDCSLLIVPGGPARKKSQALGRAGRDAINNFVRKGGHYLGFCGGAGLGLSSKGGLGLCPWERDSIKDRLQHLVSGYMQVELHQNHPLLPTFPVLPHNVLEMTNQPNQPNQCDNDNANDNNNALILPVWWPGRFCVDASKSSLLKDEKIEVLASYASAGPDFRVADLALDSLPPDTLKIWEKDYGIRIGSDFMTKQPCIIHSAKGLGSYTLSYSHLETPASPLANIWLAHLIRELSALEPSKQVLDDWKLAEMSLQWSDSILQNALKAIENMFNFGFEHGLFYKRSSWLIGWRTGIAGSHLNNLRLALYVLLETQPNEQMLKVWATLKKDFERNLVFFEKGVTQLFLAERLATILASTAPVAISAAELQARRLQLFGTPMESGGLYVELWQALDALLCAKWVKD